MNSDAVLPVVTTLAWLALVIASLASFRLKWSQMVKMALLWVAIFGGVFLVIEWFLLAQGAASGLL
jgi:hypothetical protein